MSTWIPTELTTGKLPPTYGPVHVDDVPHLADLDWRLQPYRGPGETMHYLEIDGLRLEARPDSSTTGSGRSKAIKKALRDLENGVIDPMIYVQGRLAAAGATDVTLIRLPDASL